MKIGLYNVTSTIAPIGSEEIGGVEIYSFRLAEALRKRGHEVVLYGGRSSKVSLPSRAVWKTFPYVETSSVPDFGTRFQRLIQRLHFAWSSKKDFLRESFDAVLILKPYDFITAWLWKKWGVQTRVVASLHGKEFYWGDHFFSRTVDSFYAVSEKISEDLSVRYRRTCETIPNFLDEERFQNWKRPKPLGIPRIVSVGRMVEMKGMKFLLEAFQGIQSEGLPSKLVLIGEGPEKAGLIQWARAQGLEDQVEFTGIQSEEQVINHLRSAWIYVQPSVGEESFSMSTLEAFAMGLKVLASDRVHIARVFQGKGGVELYPSRDVQSLSRCLGDNLRKPWTEIEQDGQKARDLVESEYFSEKVVLRIEKLLMGKSIT